MTPFRKSIDIISHYPLAALLALPGYLLLMAAILSDYAGVLHPLFIISLLIILILVESFLLQPALSMHIDNILEGKPEKPIFKESIRKSKFKLLALFVLIVSILIALYILYLLILGVAAVILPSDVLTAVVLALRYIIFPIPYLLLGGLYLSYLPLLAQSLPIAGMLTESFKAVFCLWKRTLPALIITGVIIFAAYWAGQIIYYAANGISLLYIIDNPIKFNYASSLTVLACMPLYGWLICYFHCLQKSYGSNLT